MANTIGRLGNLGLFYDHLGNLIVGQTAFKKWQTPSAVWVILTYFYDRLGNLIVGQTASVILGNLD